jgi:hypothetical protein
MDRLRKGGNGEAVEHLVRSTKHLFACDRAFMYNALVNMHINDADKLYEVWLMMQEENFIPSNQMKVKIARSLQREGREVIRQHITCQSFLLHLIMNLVPKVSSPF